MFDSQELEPKIDRLRRWSQVPTTLTAQQAAEKVRKRLQSRQSTSLDRRWLAAAAISVLAAVLVLAAALVLTMASHRIFQPRQTAPEPQKVVAESAVVIVPLPSGTTLYVAPSLGSAQP